MILQVYKRRPGAFTVIPGRLVKNILGILPPQGDTKKHEEKHTPLTRGAIPKKKWKKPHTSHAHNNSTTAAGVGHVATQQHLQSTQHR